MPSCSHAWSELVLPIRNALRDHTRLWIEATPASHLPTDLARELTATCIHSEHYGTRSSTLLAIDRARVAAHLHVDGPPCTAPFDDRTELLDAA